MDNEKLELAKAFENTTLSRKDATMKFGDDNTIKHFNKNKGFKEKRYEQSLIRNLNQLFKTMQPIKKSNRVYYELGESRMEVAPREDKRENNTGNELSYTKYLDAIVLMALEGNMFKDTYETTLNNWVYLFGLVNKAFFILKTAPQSKEALEIRDELRALDTVTSTSLSHEIGDFMEDYEDKRRILDNTLNKLSKDNLIKYYEVPKAVINSYVLEKNDEGELEEVRYRSTITLETENAQEIVAKQAELREKFSVTPFQIKNKYNQPEDVKERLEKYQDELDVFYSDSVYIKKDNQKPEHIELEFFYYAHAIYIKATKGKVENYLRKRRPDFYDKYHIDKNEFIKEIQQGYIEERRSVLLKKASTKADKEYKKTLEKHNGFGHKAEKELRNKLRVWDKDSITGYHNNISVMEEKLRADLNPKTNKTTFYPRWDYTALRQNTKHLDY